MTPNLLHYNSIYPSFNWQDEQNLLNGLPERSGLNIAYEAIDRHAMGHLKNVVAFRWIRKDNSVEEATYATLKKRTARFANVLQNLGVNKGETVSSFTGRIPDLYIAALGAMKKTAVFCPLFSLYGPEDVWQRLSHGNARVLVTTPYLFTITNEADKSQGIMDLPSM